MNIRLATVDDYDRVMYMYNDFVDEDRYSRHDNDSFKQVINNPVNYFYVAEADGRLVGFVCMSTRLVVRYPKPIAELDELYVDPDNREQGVGKQLVRKIEATARQQGCYRMYISSHYKFTTAHKFYETLGYKNYGRHFIKNL